MDERSQLQLRLYTLYLNAREIIPVEGRFMPYEWQNLPNSLNIIWLPYSQMLDEFSREIANAINDLTNHVRRLRAWNTAILSLSDDEKMEAVHEFIGVLGTTAVGLPFVIKSKFAHAAANLCHQANRAKRGGNWSDEFPADSKINLNETESVGRDWKFFRPFKISVEAISGSAFREATGNFRNAYNHRFPRSFVLGITGLITRCLLNENARPSYGFGGALPLQLDTIAELLSRECDFSYEAFSAFQALVHEHEAAIDAFDKENLRPSDSKK